MERIVELRPGYDREKEGYGIHGVDLRMVLKGEKGAVQFLLFTNWLLPHLRATRKWLEPLPADVGYHSPVPQYEGQEPFSDEPCPYLNNKQPCYYDGSGLRADDVFNILTEKGDEGVWEYLEEEYISLFGKDETA